MTNKHNFPTPSRQSERDKYIQYNIYPIHVKFVDIKEIYNLETINTITISMHINAPSQLNNYALVKTIALAIPNLPVVTAPFGVTVLLVKPLRALSN